MMRASLVLLAALFACLARDVQAGRILVTGHDPDFHALSPDAMGRDASIGFIQKSLAFVRGGDSRPFLFLKSNTDNLALPWLHMDSELGLNAAGFTEGTASGNHYVKVSATEFTTVSLDDYSAILLPSDYGGVLTGDDLVAINARSGDIRAYVNAGGGLVAFSEQGIYRTLASTEPQPENF